MKRYWRGLAYQFSWELYDRLAAEPLTTRRNSIRVAGQLYEIGWRECDRKDVVVLVVWWLAPFARALAWWRVHRWYLVRAMVRSGFLWNREGWWYRDAYLPPWENRFAVPPQYARLGFNPYDANPQLSVWR